LGAVPLNGSGVATFTKFGLTVGSHTITAFYNAAAPFGVSALAVLSQTVRLLIPAGTTTVLGSSVLLPVFGQPVTFTATVTSNLAGTGAPSGTVTFKNGTMTLGTATLDSLGVATLL